MDKIAVKTKITEWGTVGEKEKISFELLDFSPAQVAKIDRAIRNNGEDKYRMTIEPEQKQLQFAPVVSEVRLVSMNCMSGGQKLKIADFSSHDNSAKAIKAMVQAGTQVVITFEEIQGKLFGETEDKERPGLDDNQPDPGDESRGIRDDFEVNENGVITNPQVITVKLPKNYGTMCVMSLGKSNDNWYFGYDLSIGHEANGSPCSNDGGENIYTALMSAKNEIYEFIDRQKTFKYAKQAKKKIEKAIDNWLFENA